MFVALCRSHAFWMARNEVRYEPRIYTMHTACFVIAYVHMNIAQTSTHTLTRRYMNGAAFSTSFFLLYSLLLFNWCNRSQCHFTQIAFSFINILCHLSYVVMFSDRKQMPNKLTPMPRSRQHYNIPRCFQHIQTSAVYRMAYAMHANFSYYKNNAIIILSWSNCIQLATR